MKRAILIRCIGGALVAALGAGCNFPGPSPAATATPAAGEPVASTTPTAAASETATARPEPSPTVVHLMTPGEPAGVDRFLTDVSSEAYAVERRAPGEDFGRSRLERPFRGGTMDYLGHLDIVRAELKVTPPWAYVTVFLEAEPTDNTAYAIELDLDADGRGDWLIAFGGPLPEAWTTDGVRAYQDQNNDVGGTQPMASEPPPQTGDGYETIVFDQGLGTDPDAAWARRAPGGAPAVQMSFKTSLIGGPDGFLWGAWAQYGPMQPTWFDYNDHFSLAEAGSPLAANAEYPVRDLAAVDNTCRDAYQVLTTGLEPGLCQLPASIAGVVWKDRCLLTGGEGGEPLVLGQGCVSTAEAPYWNSDGVYEPSWEPGIAGLVVDLGAGACPSVGLATATTDSAGRYSFSGLSAGTYCVSVDLLGYGNLDHLVPGGWRVPSTVATVAGYTIALISGQNKAGVGFGWLFQFGD